MVAGGIGQTPFLALAKELGRQRFGEPPRQSPRPASDALLRCRSASIWPASTIFTARRRRPLSTDDGSAGHRGLVTDLIGPLVQESSLPAGWSLAVRRRCWRPWRTGRALGLPCQVSLETPMACGMGICFSCVAKVRDGAGHWDYRRTCVEGPVFDAATWNSAAEWSRVIAGRRPGPLRAPGVRRGDNVAPSLGWWCHNDIPALRRVPLALPVFASKQHWRSQWHASASTGATAGCHWLCQCLPRSSTGGASGTHRHQPGLPPGATGSASVCLEAALAEPVAHIGINRGYRRVPLALPVFASKQHWRSQWHTSASTGATAGCHWLCQCLPEAALAEPVARIGINRGYRRVPLALPVFASKQHWRSQWHTSASTGATATSPGPSSPP